MNYVGIDLAGSPRRPTGLCVINDRLNTHCGVSYSNEEILLAVRKSKARVAAVDAPLALPRGRHCLGEHCRGRAHFRSCDRVLTRMRIKGFPLTIGPMRALTMRGIGLKRDIEEFGVQVVETFPGASQDLLGFPRKQHDLEGLHRALVSMGCSGDVAKRSMTGDELDAISCALVARDYAKGEYTAVGDPSEIMMILPKIT
jgi:predicted nuclease with RNAse H fold